MQYHTLLKRHHLTELKLPKIVKSFKDFETTAVHGWIFEELVQYDEQQRWHYTGKLQGNPTFRKLLTKDMDFKATCTDSTAEKTSAQPPVAVPKKTRYTVKSKKRPSDPRLSPQAKRPCVEHASED